MRCSVVSAMWPYSLSWSEWFHQVGLPVVLPLFALALILVGVGWFLKKRGKK